MKGVIVCGGSIKDPRHMAKYLEDADLVIAADSGASFLGSIGVVPHVLAGDFDSISATDYASIEASGVEILRFPVEKDMTDSEIAVELAMKRGCDEVVLLGALGTRLDHSLSNVFLLKKLLERGVKCMLADEYNEVYLTDSTITLKRDYDNVTGTVPATQKAESGVRLSLLPLTGEAEGVTTKGLYYPLQDATLVTGSTWGVSNEFVEDTATVTITKGLLLVIKSRD